MRKHLRTLASLWLVALSAITLPSCNTVTGGPEQILGNDGGSEPMNANEIVEYKKAVRRCHKTGGTRVVKIEGTLRCF